MKVELNRAALQKSHYVRVYYEDTDTAGIVYYANYLRFLERGRTEFLRSLGFQQQQLMSENVSFAVTSASINYLKPARLDDMLDVRSAIGSLRRVRLVFEQEIWCVDSCLLDAKIEVACIDPRNGKPIAIRPDILEQFKRWSIARAGAKTELK